MLTDLSPAIARCTAYTPLTARQCTVALLIADAYTDKQIAAALVISEETVAFHVRQISDRLALDRSRNIRVQIAQMAVALTRAA